MSSFNNILEFDKIRDESISSLKNITNSDISNNINLNNSKMMKNSIDIKDSNQENRKEIFAAVFLWDGNDKNVYLTGSFCNWLQFFEMRKCEGENKSGEKIIKSYLLLYLPKGTYQYKFKINSIWKCNSNFPTCSDKDGNINNVMTIPQKNKEEGTTDFTTSHTTLPNLDNVYKLLCQNIESERLDEFTYKYLFNYDLLTNKNKIKNNLFLEKEEKDILNENYSYKRIYPLPHEIINHFTMKNNETETYKMNNKEKTMKYGCTFRYNNKMTTFVYYKPN